MSDMISGDRLECLSLIAASQMGYVTSRQARACDMGTNLVAYHAGTGRLVRVHRGVYRLSNFPTFPGEEVMAAWLAAGPNRAVVSHESALALHELGDVIPDRIHLTVPRSVRNLPLIDGTRIHTSSVPFRQLDVVERDGMRVTSATRTFLDLAQAGWPHDRIHDAIREGIERGVVSGQSLVEDAGARNRRVQDLVQNVVADFT